VPHRDGTLKAREFVFLCEDQAMAQLPPSLARLERRVMWTILQLYHRDPAVHFELQPHMGRKMVELGLHFEGQPEANEAWAQIIAARANEILPLLGEGWELEEWTGSWRRLHRTFRFERLNGELAREVAGHLATALTTLTPVLVEAEEEGLAPAVSAPTRHQERSRPRRFARH
jgi:hypothetical protein